MRCGSARAVYVWGFAGALTGGALAKREDQHVDAQLAQVLHARWAPDVYEPAARLARQRLREPEPTSDRLENAAPTTTSRPASASQPIVVSNFDAIWYQVGWLIMLMAFFLVVFIIQSWRVVCGASSSSSNWNNWNNNCVLESNREPHQNDSADSWKTRLYQATWQDGPLAAPLELVIYSFALLAYVGYWLQKAMLSTADRIILCMCYPFFVGVLVLRVAAAGSHPRWTCHGGRARCIYMMCSVYAHIDAFALVFTAIMTIRYHQPENYLWLSIARFTEVSSNRTSINRGVVKGFKVLQELISEERSSLLAVSLFTMVLWVITSSFYWLFNYNNPETKLSYMVNEDNDHWQRFQSIPSSMFYALQNLRNECPLADKFLKVGQNVLVGFVCMVAVPLFALPLGVLSAALSRQANRRLLKSAARKGPRNHTRNRSIAMVYFPQTFAVELEFQKVKRSRYGTSLGVGTAILVFGSIFCYFYYTASPTYLLFKFLPVNVSTALLVSVDGFVAFVFAIEWGCRLYVRGSRYQKTVPALVDLLSWVPGIIHVTLFLCMGPKQYDLVLSDMFGDWLRGLCVVRVFKIERYLYPFRDMYEISVAYGSILKAYLCSMIVFQIFFGILMYLAERNSHSPDIHNNYSTLWRAQWAVFLNLNGEWPWADYSTAGMFLAVLMLLINIVLGGIIIVVFSEGFLVMIRRQRAETHIDRSRIWPSALYPEHVTRRKVFEMFYSHVTHPGRTYTRGYQLCRALSSTVTFVAILTTVARTLPGKDSQACERESRCLSEASVFVIIVSDLVVTLCCCVEFALRFFAAGPGYVMSAVGAVDIASFCALALTTFQAPGGDGPAPSTQYILLLRLCRLFMSEQYVPSMQVLKGVMSANARPLARSGSALVSAWYLYGTLLYLLEHDRNVVCTAENEGTTPCHFRDLLTGLQFTLVHLSGDFPITRHEDYTNASKAVHVVFSVVGQAITATFAGIFTAGFISYLGGERITQRRQAIAAGIVQRAFRRTFRARCTMGLDVGTLLARGIVKQGTRPGSMVLRLIHGVLVVNVFNTLVSTVPAVICQPMLRRTINIIEAVCFVVFVIEWGLRLTASQKRALHKFKQPMRVLDFFLLIPTPLLFYFEAHNEAWQAQHAYAGNVIHVLMMFRVVRVFDFPFFRRKGEGIVRALSVGIFSLKVPAVLAANAWVYTSFLFYMCESQRMRLTMIDALYWTSIFITGEWALVDFTHIGARLCIFYCIIGIPTFAVPLGCIIETVQHILTDMKEAEKKLGMKGGELKFFDVRNSRPTTAIRPTVLACAPRQGNDASADEIQEIELMENSVTTKVDVDYALPVTFLAESDSETRTIPFRESPTIFSESPRSGVLVGCEA